MSERTLTFRRPDDFHVHLRQGELLKTLLSYTAKQFARALIMPNTIPPILTGKDALEYRDEILTALRGYAASRCIRVPDFEPLMTILVTPFIVSESEFFKNILLR